MPGGGQQVGTSQHPPPSLSHLVPGGEAGRCGPQSGPGHLAWPGPRAAQCSHTGLPTTLSPSLPPQCYGLWDHEEDPRSREHDGGHEKEKEKEKEPEEEPALLEFQTQADTGPQEEPGVAGATTEEDIQVDVRDRPPEQPVELKPRDKKRISLRFRRRKESTEPRGPAAIGTWPFPPQPPQPNLLPCWSRHPMLTMFPPYLPCPEDTAPAGLLVVLLGGPCVQSAGP